MKLLLDAGANTRLHNNYNRSCLDLVGDKDTKKNIHTLIYKPYLNVKYTTGTCPVCLDLLVEKSVWTGCGHNFHIQCLSLCGY